MMDFLRTTFDQKRNIWSGPKQDNVFNSDCSVGKVIFAAMRNWPKNVCQICDSDGVELTNGQAITWAVRIAQHLKKRGLTRDHVVGIAGANSTYIMPLAVGCLLNTTPFHAVNPSLDENAIKYVFDITKPTIIFCDGAVYEKIRSATKSYKPEIFTIRDHIPNVPKIEDLLEPTKTELLYVPEPLALGADQTVAILCSSGTTGLPKAVCISNSTIIQETMLVSSESVIFSASGLDWITGLWTFMFSAVFGCTRIISPEPFSAKLYVHLVSKYKITYSVLPPRHLCTVINSNLATPENMASIRMLNYGGGLLSKATSDRVQDIFKNALLNSGYGMTEAGAIAVNVGIGKTPSGAGKLLPGVRARIIDENGKSLGYNEVGEILIHNGDHWNGYYGNPRESRNMQDVEGWFHTGDMGYFDEKDYLHIVDRKKEILKYQGLHYWPTEIEHVILEMPEVKEVCVVGIYDEGTGDAAGAIIVKEDGCTLKEADIVNYVAKRIPTNHKQIRAGVRFVDSLPHNANSKIMRKQAKELFVSLI